MKRLVPEAAAGDGLPVCHLPQLAFGRRSRISEASARVAVPQVRGDAGRGPPGEPPVLVVEEKALHAPAVHGSSPSAFRACHSARARRALYSSFSARLVFHPMAAAISATLHPSTTFRSRM